MVAGDFFEEVKAHYHKEAFGVLFNGFGRRASETIGEIFIQQFLLFFSTKCFYFTFHVGLVER